MGGRLVTGVRVATKERVRRSAVYVLVASLSAVAVGLQPAEATLPGRNGPLYVSSGNYLLTIQGTERALEWDPGRSARFSPDGRRIAYVVSDRSTGSDNIRVRATSNEDTLVAAFDETIQELSWAADGQNLAVQTQGGRQSRIYRVPLNGTDPVLLTSSPAGSGSTGNVPGQIYGADWRPGGDEIAYYRSTYSGASDIFTVPSDGGEPTNHTNQCSYPEDDEPQCLEDTLYYFDTLNWSPDGQKLVARVSESTPDRSRVYLGIVDLDSPTPSKLDVASQNPLDPVWSPDGTKIAFTDWDGPQDGRILVVDAAEGATSRVFDRYGEVVDWQPCPEAGCPAFGTPQSSARDVWLRLRGHLVTSGEVTSDRGDCLKTTVVIQRDSGSRWARVKEIQTDRDGNYRDTVPDQPGKYRAVVPRTSTCSAGTSTNWTHRH